MKWIVDWKIEKSYCEFIEMDVWYVRYTSRGGSTNVTELCPVFNEGKDSDSYNWAVEMAIQYLEDYEIWVKKDDDDPTKEYSPFTVRDNAYDKVAKILGQPSGRAA